MRKNLVSNVNSNSLQRLSFRFVYSETVCAITQIATDHDLIMYIVEFSEYSLQFHFDHQYYFFLLKPEKEYGNKRVQLHNSPAADRFLISIIMFSHFQFEPVCGIPEGVSKCKYSLLHLSLTSSSWESVLTIVINEVTD